MVDNDKLHQLAMIIEGLEERQWRIIRDTIDKLYFQRASKVRLEDSKHIEEVLNWNFNGFKTK